jgi:putative tricarboxylic transport membrane protein
MTFHIIATLLGVLAGMFAGLLPGVGVLLMMMVALPFMLVWQPIDVLLFFAALTQISQFCGSVTTIYTGIAGEPSSIPTVIEIKKVPVSRYGELIAATSVSSLISAMLAIVFCWAIASNLGMFNFILRTDVICALFAISLVLVIKYSSNKFWTSVALTAFGIGLGLIGFNTNLDMNILTFGNSSLMQGLPLDVVMLTLFAYPQLHQMSNTKIEMAKISIFTKWPSLNYLHVLAYSILGFIGGLMPGLTMIFSSLFAYNITSRFTKNPETRIIAAETANNAGAVSQMIPLLMFGLPLVPSEALVLYLMDAKGYVPSAASAANIFSGTALLQLLAAMIGLVLAWPLANQILKILRTNLAVVRTVTLLALLLVILVQAWVDYNAVFVLICIVVTGIIGYVLKNKDTSGLIFGFLISDKLVDYFMRFHSLYF